MLFKALVLSALVAVAAAQDTCYLKPTCAACIGSEFCGWCSPAPTVYTNGTIGSRCQNQTFDNWYCNGVYSTQTCQQGYQCNVTSGQCVLAPPGQGDTLANCQATCQKTPPPPTNLSICVIVSPTVQQCQPCTDYCTNDTQCPLSYCSGGLCHGSTCSQQSTCNELCTSDTPPLLLGIWRGVMINNGYGSGEYAMQFLQKSQGPQVSFMSPSGQISTGTLQTDSTSNNILLDFQTGPLKGVTLRGGYSPWEPSAETEQQAFYFAAPNAEVPPPSDSAAMIGNGATVYAMSRCSPKAISCNFSSVFPNVTAVNIDEYNRRVLTESKTVKVVAVTDNKDDEWEEDDDLLVGVGTSPSQDPCQNFSSCSDCIAVPTGLCGWCTGNVTYNTSSGPTQGLTQCAGFDSTGKPLGWTCQGVFQKEGCSDYGCDWTDPQAPTCAVCNQSSTCTLTEAQCNSTCTPPPPQFVCDNVTKSCIPCNITYCTTDAQCPGSYCQITGPGPWECHGEAPGCAELGPCNETCSQNQTDMYICNVFDGQCQQVSNSTPGATTLYVCEHNCSALAPLGTWRGIEANVGFVRGEYDFTFYSDSTLHWRRPDGATFAATLDGFNLTKGVGNVLQITGSITSISPPQFIYAVFTIDNQGNDRIIDMLFWGQSNNTALPTFDAAMTNGNTFFVLNACRGSAAYCNFASSQVFPTDDDHVVDVTVTVL